MAAVVVKLWLVGCAAVLAAAPASAGAEGDPAPASESAPTPCQADFKELLLGNLELIKGQQALRRDLDKALRRLESLQPELEDCPEQWTAFNESCFRVGADNQTAAGAAAACAELHPRGRLASLELDHRYKVQHSLLDLSPFLRYWIGLRLEEVGWRWSDGTLLTERGEWMPPQPGRTHEEECAVYDRSGKYPGWTFGWIDEDCETLAGYVCMIRR